MASAYLDGTYSEVYPRVTRDADGIRRLFRQFSFPGGIPSHVAPETPGSIHECGELGYVFSHAYGAAFDNPELLVAAVVGDGEFETGPLAASWHGTTFIDGLQYEGTWRSHQVPLTGTRDNAEHRRLLREWMESYRPAELFDDEGRVIGRIAALAPVGDRR